MVTAYLGLGSNLGDREATLKGARAALAATRGVRVKAASPLYLTDPVGGPGGQDPYLNAVLEVQTDLSAHSLLQVSLAVEHRFGRRRPERWGARTLDIDLLFWGEAVLRDHDLVVPHPRLHLRRFVLRPLQDLAPELVHPLLGQCVRELLAALPPGDGVSPFLDRW